MNRCIKSFISLTMVILMLCLCGVGSFASDAVFEGSGTKDDPYLIETAVQFADFINSITAGESYSDVYFKQTADLDFAGVTYIVNELVPFDGIYDGAGYVFRNLNITKNFGNDPYAEGNEYLAPFGFVSGTIMNLGIEDSSVVDAYVGGGFLRKAKDGAIIINCYSTANIEGSTRGTGFSDYINSNDVIVANCYYGGTASGNALVGSAYNGDGATLTMCYYLDGCAAGESPIGEYEAVSDINSADFATTLNSNRVAAAELCGIEAEALIEWTIGDKNTSFVHPAAVEAIVEEHVAEESVIDEPIVEAPVIIEAEEVVVAQEVTSYAPQTADIIFMGSVIVASSFGALKVFKKRNNR